VRERVENGEIEEVAAGEMVQPNLVVQTEDVQMDEEEGSDEDEVGDLTKMDGLEKSMTIKELTTKNYVDTELVGELLELYGPGWLKHNVPRLPMSIKMIDENILNKASACSLNVGDDVISYIDFFIEILL
jgi:hypothetical protein